MLLLIGIPVFLVLYILLRVLRKDSAFKKGVKVANTAYLKELAIYKRGAMLHKVTSILTEIFLITAIISVLLLLARPYKTETINQGVRKRDIFLCMDNGIYLDTLNEELLDALIDVVRGLEGDRFGVSIYCSATLLYVPMTDDYEYVIQKLEDLKEYFTLLVKLDQEYGAYGYILPDALPDHMKDDYERDYARYEDLHAEITVPTYLNAYQKGYFLVGDGLASCMYSFPKFGAEDRSRVILLSTENTNDIHANPLVELKEACELCKKNKVTVFGLFRGEKAFDNSLTPNNVFLSSVETDMDYAEAKADLIQNIDITGGRVYEYAEDMSVREIVEDIQKQEAMLVEEIVINKEVDQPGIFSVLLMASLLMAVACAAVRGV